MYVVWSMYLHSMMARADFPVNDEEGRFINSLNLIIMKNVKKKVVVFPHLFLLMSGGIKMNAQDGIAVHETVFDHYGEVILV